MRPAGISRAEKVRNIRTREIMRVYMPDTIKNYIGMVW
jgi:hypothetical protein